MKVHSLGTMTGGWFVGDFSPSVWRTSDFEVGVKFYKKGDLAMEHYHAVATEMTLIASGKAKIKDQIFAAGDIVELAPGESASFEALEDCMTVVVKVPSVMNDKFMGRKK